MTEQHNREMASDDGRRGLGANGSTSSGRRSGTSNRGFASMDRSRQREIASKGGRAAHEKGTAHEWTADEARSAGRKGGQVSRGGRGRLIVSTQADETGTATPASGEAFKPKTPERTDP